MTDASRAERFTLSSAAGLRIEKVRQPASAAVAKPDGVTGSEHGWIVEAPRPAVDVEVRRAAREPMNGAWYLIDAAGLDITRAAKAITTVLRGKHKPTYVPHVPSGDHVVVINADKVRWPGVKGHRKAYYGAKNPVVGGASAGGNVREGRSAEQMLKSTVRRMIVRGPLGRAQFRNLKIFVGADHGYSSDDLQALDIAAMELDPVRRGRSTVGIQRPIEPGCLSFKSRARR